MGEDGEKDGLADEFNLKRIEDPHAFEVIGPRDVGEGRMRLMLTGYSVPPEDYEARTYDFVTRMVRALGADNVALVTSPTANKGSIDAIGTSVAQRSGAKIMYITSEAYVKYIDPAGFPADIDRADYAAHAKYVLPADRGEDRPYPEASSIDSNCLLVTGGREVALTDAVKAVLRGNRVVVAEDLSAAPAWDFARGRVDNAAAYIREQVESLRGNGVLKYEARAGFTEAFLRAHQEAFHFVREPEEAAGIFRRGLDGPRNGFKKAAPLPS